MTTTLYLFEMKILSVVPYHDDRNHRDNLYRSIDAVLEWQHLLGT